MIKSSILIAGLFVLNTGASDRILSKPDISDEQIAWMEEQSFLLDGETPIFFYQDDPRSIEVGGNLLTDQYVGSWWRDEGELGSRFFKLGELCEIEKIQDGGRNEVAIYRLYGPDRDEEWAEVWLSVVGDRHLDFIRRTNTFNNRRMNDAFKAFCDRGEAVDWSVVRAANGIPDRIQTKG